MRYTIIPVTPFEQNCTIFWCEKTRQAAVIDPGGDIERVLDFLDQEKLTLAKILVTHGHIDHAGGVAALAARTGAPIEGPQEEDRFWIQSMPQQSKMFGVSSALSFEPGRWLHAGDKVNFGEIELEVLHCPATRPAMSSSSIGRAGWRRSGTYCFRGRSGAPTSPVAITTR